MIKLLASLLLVSCMCALAACNGNRDRMSEVGFALPEGDANTGRQAFLYMQCNQCHTITGEELPVLDPENPPFVELGGPVSKVKTYGELVTAIINPSHELAERYAEEVVSENGESKMYNYNRHMTVQELVDLVMFLQPYYKIVVPTYYYRGYP